MTLLHRLQKYRQYETRQYFSTIHNNNLKRILNYEIQIHLFFILSE